MTGRRNVRRGSALLAAVTLVLGLLAAVAVDDPPAGAAKVTAFGPAFCGTTGRVMFSPPLSASTRANTVMKLRASVGCITGSTGDPGVVVRSGKLVAQSAPFTGSCRSLGLGAVLGNVRWKADGGSVSPTSLVMLATAQNPSAMSFDLAGQGATSGSYPGQTLAVHVVGDGGAGGLCGAGAKRFTFTGARGQSLVTVASASNAVIFQDQFNGTGLDRTKWRPNWVGANDNSVTKPVNTQEQSCYDPAQVSVGGGVLHLRAASRPCLASNGVTYPFASGLVESNHKFTFTYGRMEARIWLPPGSGPVRNWPAFWANGTGQWPTTGELNVVEGLQGDACWHFHSSSGGPGGCAPLANPAGWHTFAADWRPGVVTYFYDGVQVGRITSGITGAPMYLVLNLGVSSLKGPVSLPSEMLVDYVRVTR